MGPVHADSVRLRVSLLQVRLPWTPPGDPRHGRPSGTWHDGELRVCAVGNPDGKHRIPLFRDLGGPHLLRPAGQVDADPRGSPNQPGADAAPPAPAQDRHPNKGQSSRQQAQLEPKHRSLHRNGRPGGQHSTRGSGQDSQGIERAHRRDPPLWRAGHRRVHDNGRVPARSQNAGGGRPRRDHLPRGQRGHWGRLCRGDRGRRQDCAQPDSAARRRRPEPAGPDPGLLRHGRGDLCPVRGGHLGADHCHLVRSVDKWGVGTSSGRNPANDGAPLWHCLFGHFVSLCTRTGDPHGRHGRDRGRSQAGGAHEGGRDARARLQGRLGGLRQNRNADQGQTGRHRLYPGGRREHLLEGRGPTGWGGGQSVEPCALAFLHLR
mmetsp:Transcript_30053/g.70860  ORF Transcript_30053/g.70860 Transcript_30053/m.70860 type:complete len:376 (+) Transcript_30053:1116-2243(+)